VKLTDKALRALLPKDKPYKASDGGGLYLLVNPNGSRLWRFDYQLKGKRGTVALGVYQNAGGTRGPMSLAAARLERDRCRELLRQGVRPADAKALEAARVRDAAAAAREKARVEREARKAAAEAKREKRQTDYWTVERVAEAWSEAHTVGLAKSTVRGIRQTLRDHVYPDLGAKPIASVTTGDIIDLIQKILDGGHLEVAKKVRQRLGAIWQFAVLKHYAPGDVVAPTSREVGKRLKAARTARPAAHYACVPPGEAPALMRAIRGYQGSPATRAGLLLLAYTFVRTGELRFARWTEFVLFGDAPTWTIPAERMKVKRRGDRAADDHVVPLSRQAVDMLRELKAMGLDDESVLPHSRKPGKVMSENTLLYALWDLGFRGRMTGHGFRALASTILHEAGFDSALIEAQLAHEKKDRIAAAYNRAKHLERRRIMMQAYADILDGRDDGKVVPLVRAS
jgi:integrase